MLRHQRSLNIGTLREQPLHGECPMIDRRGPIRRFQERHFLGWMMMASICFKLERIRTNPTARAKLVNFFFEILICSDLKFLTIRPDMIPDMQICQESSLTICSSFLHQLLSLPSLSLHQNHLRFWRFQGEIFETKSKSQVRHRILKTTLKVLGWTCSQIFCSAIGKGHFGRAQNDV